MDRDEKGFEERKAKISAFKNELKELMNKYKFGKSESDNYNATEEYCGTDHYFVVDGETWYVQTIDEIIDECV